MHENSSKPMAAAGIFIFPELQNTEPNSKILDPSHFDTKQETAQQILSKFWNIAKVRSPDQSKLETFKISPKHFEIWLKIEITRADQSKLAEI